MEPAAGTGMRTFHRLEKVSRMLQSRICPVLALGRKPHRRPVAPSRPGLGIVRTAAVPRQPYQNRSVASIVVVVLLYQQPRNLIVDLLVVVFRWLEDSGCLGVCSRGDFLVVSIVVEGAASGGNENADTECEFRRRGRGGG